MNASSKQSVGSAEIHSSLQDPERAFELNAEIDGLRGEGNWHGGRNSKTLVKYSDFRVVLMVLNSGARLAEHKAVGSISVQTISGHIRMHAQGREFDLPNGHVLTLGPGVMHDVEALEESALLLTMAWHGAEKS